MFQPASPEERKIYYNEEWNKKDVPDFIVDSMQNREFGFDHDGSGPNDRYNQLYSVDQLEKFLKTKYPYAVYNSISFYEKPYYREGWIKAELVFDIDAKDLPVRRCNCTPGNVCEICLEDAKEFLFLVSDALQDDFNLKDIRYVYSGRGYHIRVFDEEIVKMGGVERGYILDYVSGGIIPDPDRLRFKRGYPKIFKERLLKFLQLIDEEKLKNISGIGHTRAREIIKKKRRIANEIEEGNFKPLEAILGKKTYTGFIEYVRRFNAEMLDGKVTVDPKRILRLPSSLHSTASMKCMEVKNLERFDPLRDAVPKFVGERKE
jgi:DNA primase small subunit